ncbi:MAG: hypothetical protein RIE74_05715, partial [Pseudomonadales bacterium]
PVGAHGARGVAGGGRARGVRVVRAGAAAERLEAAITRNEADHAAAGHWGVPTCAFQGEPFFGQDRLDVLLWRLQQHGLVKRG